VLGGHIRINLSYFLPLVKGYSAECTFFGVKCKKFY